MIHAQTVPQLPAILKLLGHELRWRLITALVRSDYQVSELGQLVGEPLNLISYHLKQLRDNQLVHERRSSNDARHVYYSLDLDQLRALYFAAGGTLHPALGEADEHVSGQPSRGGLLARVLFLCTHNSARSQMAEGILRHMSKGRIEVASAGSAPSEIHTYTFITMDKRGIDISGQTSKDMAQYTDQSFDYVITVCDRAREACPTLPGDPERIHWSFPDPAAVIGDEATALQAFDQVATQLTTRIGYLLGVIERRQQAA